MADFKLNDEGDLDISSGVQLITEYDEEARQRLQLALGLNLGEWFADATFGLPWIKNQEEDFPDSIRYMLGDKLPDSPRFVSGVLDDYIEDLDYITSVTSTYQLDESTRVYQYTPVCTLSDGTVITLIPFQAEL